MSASGVVFLMYHELESPGRPLCQAEPGYVRYILRAADFRAQMELLQQKGWRGVSVGEAIRNFAENSVAITFDDGCETDLLYAAPVLGEMKCGATFYVTAGFIGKSGYLKPSQLQDLSRMGFEIGCHSMTHAYLTDVNDTDLHRETAEAKAQLEQILGKPVEHFSCPGGRHNARVSDAARRAGYRTVATSRIQKNSAASDVFALGRVAVMRSTPLSDFEQICEGRKMWQRNLQEQLRSAARNLLGNSTYDSLRAYILRDRIAPPPETESKG